MARTKTFVGKRRFGIPRTAALLGAALLLPASSHHVEVPVDVQIPMLVNVLHFDRSLRDESDQEVVIVVAYQQAYGPSRDLREALVAQIAEGGADDINGKHVRWAFVEVGSPSQLADELREQNADVLYLTPLRFVDVAALTAAAAALDVFTVSSVPEYMNRGASVAFGLRGSRPIILINPRAARAAGTVFGAQLLQVAQLVGEVNDDRP
jgi:hypothetical protein